MQFDLQGIPFSIGENSYWASLGAQDHFFFIDDRIDDLLLKFKCNRLDINIWKKHEIDSWWESLKYVFD